MTPAEGIAKLGFRRWYERQLIEGHVSLVTCLLSMILVAACFEQIDWHGPVLKLLFMIAVISAGAWLCLRAVLRYNFLLFRAEHLGEQSSCGQCRTYGVLQVLGAGGDTGQGAETSGSDNSWIRVRCKKCGHEWRMHNK